MTARWYLIREVDGPPHRLTIGPMLTSTLMDLASSGGVCPNDCARMEGVHVEVTVGQFMAMVRSGTVPNIGVRTTHDELPDWLSDVAKNETITRPSGSDMPDWLAEMLQDEICACLSAKPPTPIVNASPDWLVDIREIEQSLQLVPAAPPTSVQPATSPSKPSSAPSAKVLPTPPVSAAPSAPPIKPNVLLSPPAVRPPAPNTVRSPAHPPGVSPGLPSTPPESRVPPSLLPSEPVSLEPQGYNPETGQILDAVAYARWQKADAKRRQEELHRHPAMSVAQAFVEAQRALQEWVDADANKSLVETTDMNALRTCTSILTLLRRYEGYGPVMREKLLKRLDFLVENRRKFFKAFG